nr:ABC transporter ATP-binding protein [uncultured Cellulosilyticum sp.]
MKKPVIVFEDFSFQYNAQANPTLKNINLTIYEGEKVLIVGPSGSGKSTLGHTLNGLIPFNYKGEITGSLRIKGKETKNLSLFEVSRMVGTVLQDPDHQFIGLTVAEDIAFLLENECVVQEKMHQKVKEVAEMVEIQDHLGVAPQRLSGGQKQRVTLGGVMVGEADILLFDEPLASLDPATGKNAMYLIDSLQKQTGQTMIIIEHRLEDVLEANVDRIIVMNEGSIVADLSPQAILTVSPSILKNVGVREPLYVTALKYAGCQLNTEMGLEHINTLRLDEMQKGALANWYKRQSPKEVAKEHAEALLSFKNVSFSYEGKKNILEDISFDIYKGEMISLVGRNGAGKSTLSKLICGFYRPSEGKILFKGEDLKNKSIKERAENIGVVLQNPNQMISKNMIFDEVALGLRLRGVSEEIIKEKVYETLKICGLYRKRNWPISALSYGQKKRVTIASILVLKPELIILDEPTAGQDYKHYTEMMQFLKELNQKGITILMITHDMHLMLEYTSRALVLSEGKLLADQAAYEVLTNEDLVGAASLKMTSLYELALRAELKNAQDFVKCFIEEERNTRC